VIIGILATFVAPNVIRSLGTSKVKLARAKMALIENALDRFYMDCGRYPSDAEGLDALLYNTGDPGWNGPYLKQSQIIDPWGTPYIYVAEGAVNQGSYDIISLGADGQEGGDGENADIYND
jgi:general secretion pathway protein G